MKNFFTQLQTISILSLLGMVSFFGTLKSPFVYDDAHAIVDNPYIQNLGDFQNQVGIENIFNRSVVLLSYAVNREVGQLNVFGFHLVNVLLHVCVGITLYFLVRHLLFLESPKIRSRLFPLPMLAASIHLLHPMTVETVTYLSSRSSLLVTLFYLLGFYFFVQTIRMQEKGSGFRRLFYASLVVLFFLLGAGSKGIVVTLPVMGVIYLWFRVPKMEPGKRVRLCVLVLSPLLIYLGVRYVQMGDLFTLKADPDSMSIDRVLYFLTQVKVLVFYYLGKLLLPFNLNFEPDVRLVSGIRDPEWMAGVIIMVLLGASLYLQESRLLKFAALWALVTILPTSSFIPLKQIVTEHRAYLPGIGFCLGLGVGILTPARLGKSRAQMIFPVLLVFAFLTCNRGLDFRTPIQLWEDTAKKSPQKALVHNNLAAGHLAKERLEDAKRELAITLNLDPLYTDAHLNLGFIYSRKEKWKEAKTAFDRALFLGSTKADAFFNAGRVRNFLNQPQDAIPFLIKAVKMKPHRTKYHFELGNAYRLLNRKDEALAEYRLTLKSDPDHLEAHNNIGVIFWTLKQYELAEKAFMKAVALGADNFEIHNNLSSIYMIQKKPGRAIPHLRRLVFLQPKNAKARQLLKIALTLENAGHP
jgi:tetratricopeptide (TPR) repeat protein